MTKSHFEAGEVTMKWMWDAFLPVFGVYILYSLALCFSLSLCLSISSMNSESQQSSPLPTLITSLFSVNAIYMLHLNLFTKNIIGRLRLGYDSQVHGGIARVSKDNGFQLLGFILLKFFFMSSRAACLTTFILIFFSSPQLPSKPPEYLDHLPA